MSVLLSVCLPAMCSRNWIPLAESLHSQCRKAGQAELIVVSDSGALTSGQKRQQLAALSRGEYRAFVDDDDSVAPNYVDSLLAGCREGCDVISFDVRKEIDGVFAEREKFTLCSDGAAVSAEKHVVGMTVNHLCAWRRELAALVGWDPTLGYGDDQLWYKPLLLFFPEPSECHLDQMLYTYQFSRAGTQNQQNSRRQFSLTKYAGGVEVFSSDTGLLISTSGHQNRTRELVEVRDSLNNIHVLPRKSIQLLGKVRIQ